MGDLGNIQADINGNAKMNMEIEKISLYGDEVYNIIGRSITVHDLEDDLGTGSNEESMNTGNAGPHVAFGVIGISGPLSH